MENVIPFRQSVNAMLANNEEALLFCGSLVDGSAMRTCALVTELGAAVAALIQVA